MCGGLRGGGSRVDRKESVLWKSFDTDVALISEQPLKL